MHEKPNFKFEKSIINDKKNYIAGIDEVGRGTLAGPVTVGISIITMKNYL